MENILIVKPWPDDARQAHPGIVVFHDWHGWQWGGRNVSLSNPIVVLCRGVLLAPKAVNLLEQSVDEAAEHQSAI